MADYQPLIARAVAGLEKNNGEARRALYERARTALVAQLRGLVPALDESEITRERLALEEAIRKVEAETARRSRFDQPKPEPGLEPEPERDPRAESRLAPKPKTEQIAARPGSMGRTTPVASPATAEARRLDRPDPPPRPPRPPRAEPETARTPPVSPPGPPPAPEPAEAPAARVSRSRPTHDRPSLTAEGLKGFRDVMAEPPPPVPERSVFAPAPPPPPERSVSEPAPPPPPELSVSEPVAPSEPAASPPPPLPPLSPPADLDRIEWREPPRIEPREPARSRPEPERHASEPERPLRPSPPRNRMPREAPLTAARDRSPEFTQDMPDYSVMPRPRPLPTPPPVGEPQDRADRLRHGQPLPAPRPVGELEEEEEQVARPPRSYRGLVRMLVVAAVVAAFAGAGAVIYAYPGTILAWVNPFKGGSTPVPARDATATRTNKIPDRVVGPGVPEFARPGSVAGPAVAQRVVLYEDDPGDPQGRQYVGSAIWRTELVSPGPGLAPELAVRADVEIPERRITMAWSIRRNTDQNLPASHTIEIMFNLPADFPHGGISNVPGIMMKQAEATRGTPLAGLAVKVTTGYFLIGLSAVESDLARNVQLLKERAWFDVPVLYNDNRRAIIAIEKGNPGDRAFSDAFAAWGTAGGR